MSFSDHSNSNSKDQAPGLDPSGEPADQLVRVRKFHQSFIQRLLRRTAYAIFGFHNRLRFGSIGSNSRIKFPNWIKGKRAVHIGRNVQIWRFARITAINPESGCARITIGDDCVIHPSIHISAVSSVVIGRGALIAANCYITDHDHNWKDIDVPAVTNEHVIARDTTIGDFVWLGEKVMILKGVTIGSNSIIGSGSVVTRSIPSHSVAVGNPARVIKTFDHDVGEWIRVSDHGSHEA